MDTEQELRGRSWFIVSLVCVPLFIFVFRNWFWQLRDINPFYALEVIILVFSIVGTAVYWAAGWFWANRLSAQQDYIKMLKEQPKWRVIIIMIILVIIGAHLVFGTPSRREYFLWEAIRRNNAVMVAELLDKGVNPNIVNEDEITPLAVAVSNRSIEIINILVKHNAKVNVRPEYGYNILGEPLESGMDRVTTVLIKAGAKTDFGNEHLKTLYAQYLERQQRYKDLK